MGVPAFFAWLMRKYPDVLTDVPDQDNGTAVSAGEADGSGAAESRRRGESSSARRRRVAGRGDGEHGECGDACAHWRCDNLYLDMNGIIHPCCHPEGGKPQPANEAEMFENVGALLDTLVAKMKPTKVLFLAIDGVAPRAKMNQQRARRFRSQADAKQARVIEAKLRAKMLQEGLPVPPPRPTPWDHNVITPGTKFMANLTVYLRRLTTERISHDPAWKHLAVVLSDASVPGEGEHKLIEFVRHSQGQHGYDPNARHVIVGDDADLIMLALATHELHFTIVRTRRFIDRAAEASAAAKALLAVGKREEAKAAATAGATTAHFLDGAGAAVAVQEAETLIKNGDDEDDAASQWQLLHIPVLREYLWQEFTDYLQPQDPRQSDVDFERLIDDFVFLCFFVGNDFLPHLPSLNIREGALDLLLQLYKSTTLKRKSAIGAQKNGHGQQTWSPQWLTEEGQVDFAALYPLIERLGEVEVAIFDRRRQRAARESKPKNQTQCAFFVRQGHCREGDSCPYLHGDICPLDIKNAAAETECRKQLQAFAATGEGELAMGTGMNSYQRRICHQMADEYRLGHESRGDGQQRQIYVWRRVESSIATTGHSTVSTLAGDAGQQEKQMKQQDRDAGMIKETFDNALRVALEQAEQAEAQALDDGLELGQGDDWRGDYYEVKFRHLADGVAGTISAGKHGTIRANSNGRSPPEGLLREYLQGLQWVLHYYYKGVPSWSWYFPFHYAPTATDLARTLRPRPGEPAGKCIQTTWSMSTPLDPLSQLMGVLPAASAGSLPAVCQELMSSESSPIIDFYPVEFALDPNGSRARWQWIALLPFIDENRLRRVVRERVLPQLTKEETARNAKGVAILFAHRESILGKVLVRALGDQLRQSGKKVKAELRFEEKDCSDAESIWNAGHADGLPLSGQVWLPKRRVGKALAKLHGAEVVTAAGFALQETKSSRTFGVQPGAIPPPSVLRAVNGGQRRLRPRMLLADLQARIRERKRQKQQHEEPAGTSVVDVAACGGRSARIGGRAGWSRAIGGRAKGRGRGRGRVRGRGRGRSRAGGIGMSSRQEMRGAGGLVADEANTHELGARQQAQLFVLDRVGTRTQHHVEVDAVVTGKADCSDNSRSIETQENRRSTTTTAASLAAGPHSSSMQKRQQDIEAVAPPARRTANKDDTHAKRAKNAKKAKKTIAKKKRRKEKRQEMASSTSSGNVAQLFVIDRTGAIHR